MVPVVTYPPSILILFMWVILSPRVFLLRDCPPGSEFCAGTCHLPCGLTKHCFGNCPWQCLNHGNAGSAPWYPWGTAFTKPPVKMYRHRSTKVRCQDRSKANTTLFQLLQLCSIVWSLGGLCLLPGPTVGAMEAAQTLAPSQCVCIRRVHSD